MKQMQGLIAQFARVKILVIKPKGTKPTVQSVVKAGVNLKAALTSLNRAFLAIERLSLTFTANGKRQK